MEGLAREDSLKRRGALGFQGERCTRTSSCHTSGAGECPCHRVSSAASCLLQQRRNEPGQCRFLWCRLGIGNERAGRGGSWRESDKSKDKESVDRIHQSRDCRMEGTVWTKNGADKSGVLE